MHHACPELPFESIAICKRHGAAALAKAVIPVFPIDPSIRPFSFPFSVGLAVRKVTLMNDPVCEESDALSMEIVVLELTLVGVAVSPGSLAGAMHAPGNKFPLVDTAINKGERTTSLNNAIAEVAQIDVTRAHTKGAATMGFFISKLPP